VVSKLHILLQNGPWLYNTNANGQSDRGEIDTSRLISHIMKLSEVEMAYKMFSIAGEYNTLKILLVNDKIEPPS